MKGLFRGARRSVTGLAFMLALVGGACMTAVPAVAEDYVHRVGRTGRADEVAPLPDLRTQNAAGLKLAILPNGILHLAIGSRSRSRPRSPAI